MPGTGIEQGEDYEGSGTKPIMFRGLLFILKN